VARDLNKPLRKDALAYVLCFEPKRSLYGPPAAQACIAGLKEMNFTGRCEFYVRDVPHPHMYLVGLGLKNAAGSPQPSYEWWKCFVQAVAKATEPTAEVVVDKSNSEMGDLDGVRATFISRGTVEFLQGMPQWIDETEDSWFISECKRIMGCEAQRL
jgi:hypothetical protein